MSHKPNHEADIQNANKGTAGTNITWDKAQGNRGQQMNPNQHPEKQAPAAPAASSAGTKQGKR